MATSEQDLLNDFGRAVLTHNAALFVGAGMSRVAAPNSPDWVKLIEHELTIGGAPVNAGDFALLGGADAAEAVDSAVRLLTQAMYLRS